MNLPNSITLFRVVLIPFFINLMIYGYYRAALAIFVVACITDALDGMIARLMKSKTDLGAFLDPMADKLLIVSAFITLVLLKMLPVWLAIIVISRDVILVFGSIIVYFMQHNFTIQPSHRWKAHDRSAAAVRNTHPRSGGLWSGDGVFACSAVGHGGRHHCIRYSICFSRNEDRCIACFF